MGELMADCILITYLEDITIKGGITLVGMEEPTKTDMVTTFTLALMDTMKLPSQSAVVVVRVVS